LIFRSILFILPFIWTIAIRVVEQMKIAIIGALTSHKEEVRNAVFPGPEHAFTMPAEALERLTDMLHSK
jgi:hypothetical protein